MGMREAENKRIQKIKAFNRYDMELWPIEILLTGTFN